jgi:hypothetical protein
MRRLVAGFEARRDQGRDIWRAGRMGRVALAGALPPRLVAGGLAMVPGPGLVLGRPVY